MNITAENHCPLENREKGRSLQIISYVFVPLTELEAPVFLC